MSSMSEDKDNIMYFRAQAQGQTHYWAAHSEEQLKDRLDFSRDWDTLETVTETEAREARIFLDSDMVKMILDGSTEPLYLGRELNPQNQTSRTYE